MCEKIGHDISLAKPCLVAASVPSCKKKLREFHTFLRTLNPIQIIFESLLSDSAQVINVLGPKFGKVTLVMYLYSAVSKTDTFCP